MAGTLTNGRQTIAWENVNAPGAHWLKGFDTDLDPIVKNCVVVTELDDAKGHPSATIPDGTRMIGISDDKEANAPVLGYSRVEFTIFANAVRDGQFDKFLASDEEMAAAARMTADAIA